MRRQEQRTDPTRVSPGDVINKVSPSKIDGHLAIDGGLLEDSEGHSHGQMSTDISPPLKESSDLLRLLTDEAIHPSAPEIRT